MVRSMLVLAAELTSVLGCGCDYHKGGCTIVTPPAPGHLCHCHYKGAWTCRGDADAKCDAGSQSWCCSPGADAGTRSSKECCQEGGGDCGGYGSAEETNTTLHHQPSIEVQDGFGVQSEVSVVISDDIGGEDKSQQHRVDLPVGEDRDDVDASVHTGNEIGELEELEEFNEELDENSEIGTGFLQSTDQGCACNYMRRRAHGCKIVTAPKPTFMCQCHYKGAWTCQGNAIGCDATDGSACCRGDATEATRTSKACCQHAKSGDCDGY